MSNIYRVVDWEERYEIAQSRRSKNHSWVAIPNTHSGSGYSVVAQHPKAAELFCAFILIVEVASTTEKRGILVSKGGQPITAKNLAFRTHYPVEIFELAFKELVKPEIGWLSMREKSERGRSKV